jgi:O-antigen ligase
MDRLGGGTNDGSVDERGQLFLAALKVGADNPIIGAGFGYTYEWSERVAPHNEWLMMFAERGIIGFIIYALFYVFIWVKSGRYAKLFVIIFGLSALSSHNGLELPATYLLTALAYLIKDEDYLHLNSSCYRFFWVC